MRCQSDFSIFPTLAKLLVCNMNNPKNVYGHAFINRKRENKLFFLNCVSFIFNMRYNFTYNFQFMPASIFLKFILLLLIINNFHAVTYLLNPFLENSNAVLFLMDANHNISVMNHFFLNRSEIRPICVHIHNFLIYVGP